MQIARRKQWLHWVALAMVRCQWCACTRKSNTDLSCFKVIALVQAQAQSVGSAQSSATSLTQSSASVTASASGSQSASASGNSSASAQPSGNNTTAAPGNSTRSATATTPLTTATTPIELQNTQATALAPGASGTVATGPNDS